jgi:hypothetical protein
MLWLYESFFPVVWIAFLLYRQIKATDTKTTQRLEPAASRILRVLTFLIAIVLLSTTRIPLRWLYFPLWPSGFWPFWLGAALTVAGILFAVWAREHLGRNWSRSVTIKQGHELIHHRSLCSGPSPNLQRHSDRVSWHRDCNLPGARVLRHLQASVANFPTDVAARSLLTEIIQYPSLPPRWQSHETGLAPPLLTVAFTTDVKTLRFFSTLTVFATARYIAVDELRVECTFPADEQTAELCRSWRTACRELVP